MFKMCFRSRVPAIPRLRLSLSRSAEAAGDLSFSNSDRVQQQTFLFSNCTANTDTAQICTPRRRHVDAIPALWRRIAETVNGSGPL